MISIYRYWKAALSGGVAAGDQALNALSNFLFSVMVARGLGVAGVAEFATLYAIIVFAHAVHAAFVAEPFSVKYASRGDSGASLLAACSAIVFLVVSILFFLAISGVDKYRYLFSVDCSFFFALSACLLYWCVKPYYYKYSKALQPLFCSLIYSLILLFSAYAAYVKYSIEVSPFFLIGISATLSAMPLLWQVLRQRLNFLEIKEYLYRFLRYAVWSVPSAILLWSVNNSFFLLMPLFREATDIAALKVIISLLLPVNHLLAGVCMFFLPRMSKLCLEGRLASIKRLSSFLIISATVLSLLLLAVLWFFAEAIIALTYGPTFDQYAADLQIAGALLPVGWVLVYVWRTVLRAMGQPRTVFCSYGAVLLCGGWLLILWGSRGGTLNAIISISLINFGIAACLWWYMNKLLKRASCDTRSFAS